MKFNAVIFDLDGTLLDSLRDIADSMNIVLSGMGFPSHSPGEYRYLVGDGAENLVIRSLPEGERSQEAVKKGLESMREEYARRWSINTRPYEGIPGLLEALKGINIRMAVLSNKADFFTKAMVDHFFGTGIFDIVAGVGPSVAKKPDPAPALLIARELHAEPGRILFLGDTKTDMETAQRAGMFPVGALWGFRDAAELEGHGALGLIEKPMDLLRYFQRGAGPAASKP